MKTDIGKNGKTEKKYIREMTDLVQILGRQGNCIPFQDDEGNCSSSCTLHLQEKGDNAVTKKILGNSDIELGKIHR